MTHTYNITNMTCGSCISKVKSELLKLGDVTSADVQLQAPQATITMQKHIPTSVLQDGISKAGEKYQITDADTSMSHHGAATQDAADTGNSYFPIFLVFGYITGITLVVQAAQGSFHLMQWMSHFMA